MRCWRSPRAPAPVRSPRAATQRRGRDARDQPAAARHLGRGLWAIQESARGWTLAGVAGLWPYRHVDIAPPVTELVFALDEGCWGRGLANEAGGALLGYAPDMLGWQTAQASTDFGNNASIRTLTRLDFVQAEVVPEQGGLLRIFRRTL